MVKKALTETAANKGFSNTERFTLPQNVQPGEKKQLLGTQARQRALIASADILEAEAEALRRQAAILAAKAKQRKIDAERREMWKQVARLIEHQHLTEEQAVNRVAAGLRSDPEHVWFWLNWAKENKAAYAVWNRDREIMRMAKLGYTNKEIASSAKIVQWHGNTMHEKSISRIISRKINRKKPNILRS